MAKKQSGPSASGGANTPAARAAKQKKVVIIGAVILAIGALVIYAL